jgi:hypothetical protein
MLLFCVEMPCKNYMLHVEMSVHVLYSCEKKSGISFRMLQIKQRKLFIQSKVNVGRQGHENDGF